MVLQPPWNSFS